jgi:hypothetical protein
MGQNDHELPIRRSMERWLRVLEGTKFRGER